MIPFGANVILLRMLRDCKLGSRHQAVTKALFDIFCTLGLACVPCLPKVPEMCDCAWLHCRQVYMTGCDACSGSWLHSAVLCRITLYMLRDYMYMLLDLAHVQVFPVLLAMLLAE